MKHSPATILREALTDKGVGVLPSSVPDGQTPNWPIYVSRLPTAPDNAICVYDTEGRREGRIMKTGESVAKPGFQIRVRDANLTNAWVKMGEVQGALDEIRNLIVTIGKTRYTVAAVTQIGTPMPLSSPIPRRHEQNTADRDNITLNGTLTVKELDNG